MLYIVTATLNGLRRTQRLIASLAQVQSVPVRIIVVDNGSTDGTVEWLMGLTAKTQDGQDVPLVPRILQVIANAGNLGASAAWNQGIRMALANGATAILVCGNDTVPQPGAVERLYARIQSGMAFVTGTPIPYDAPDSATMQIETTDPLIEAPDFSFFMLSPRAVDVIGKWDAGIEIEQQCRAKAEGAPSPNPLMNPWEWGLFDSRYYPAYFEDGDYHIRAKYAGLPCLRDPLALFRHDTSATIRENPELAKLNHETTFRRNAELFKAKWGGLPHELKIQQSRPLNVTDEQWLAMCGGVEPVAISHEAAVKAANQTYARYGIEPVEATA